MSRSMASISRRYHHLILLWALGLASALLADAAQATGVNIQPASGEALIVHNSTGTVELLRIQGDGSNISVGGFEDRKLLIDDEGRVLSGAGPFDPNPKNRYPVQINGPTGTFNDSGLRLQNTTENTGWSFYPSSSGALLVGKIGNLGSFNGTTGAYTTVSDERAKTGVRPLENVMSRVMSLQLSRYRYKSAQANAGESIGLTAQNLQQQFPEFVSVNATGEGNPTAPQQLFVDYAGLSVVALRALQEQQQQIQTLQAELQSLKARLSGAR